MADKKKNGFTIRPKGKLADILDKKSAKEFRSKNSIVIEVLNEKFL